MRKSQSLAIDGPEGLGTLTDRVMSSPKRVIEIQIGTEANQPTNPFSLSDAELLMEALEGHLVSRLDDYNQMLSLYTGESNKTAQELLDSLTNGELAGLIDDVKRLADFTFIIGQMAAADLREAHQLTANPAQQP